VLCLALTQCGGGGGGGGGGSSGFTVTDASYARGINQGNGLEVVSPLSLVDTDPVTGLIVPGTLRPLGDGIDLKVLVSMGLGPAFKPVVVPRNGIIVLQFASSVDPASIVADQLTDTGKVVKPGSIQLRFQNGRGVPVELLPQGSRVLINPIVNGQVGLPASPVVFDKNGNPVPDATGFLRLILPRQGNAVVRSSSGSPLGQRADGLGDLDNPIGLNPGNSALDFIEQNKLFPSPLTFNGFLPDETAPRIVRDYKVEGTIDLAAGDQVGVSTILDVAQSFSAIAHGGRGEWADKLLILRPGKKNQELHAIDSNTENVITIKDTFTKLPADGDAYRLTRGEFFEPQPADPIDPPSFDPDNPQNENNRDLRNFVTFEEIDAKGNVSDDNQDGRTLYTAFDTVPSRSIAKVRFSEPIDVSTALPFESFRVTDDPEPDEPGFEHIGVVAAADASAALTYVAKRVDQANAKSSEYQGFVPSSGEVRAGSLQLILRTVPDNGYLREHMSREQYSNFQDKGFRGITDLGGRPLAFSNSDFDVNIGYIDYGLQFQAQTTSGEQYSDVGGVVHLFRGVPVSGNDPNTGDPGVHFADRPEFYGPHLADINLRVTGRLSGAAVTFVQKPLDDANPPPDGQFFPFPFGVGAPLSGIFGIRFQHVYRALECSPNPTDLGGSFLDLRKVSWSPIGGNVTTDNYENISIHAAHSEVVPDTTQSAGVPNDPFSGLGQAYDPETPFKFCDGTSTQKKQNYVAPLITTVPPKTRYLITQTNLFSPPGDANAYHPWPEFVDRFPYNNSDSLMLEYRIRPQTTGISFQNGFTFSPGILSTALPRFRVFSIGDPSNPLDPDDFTDIRVLCAQDNGSGANFGDNSRYFAVFDYVKVRSRILSSFIGVTGTSAPDYSEPIFDPPLADLPSGTEVKVEYQGADGPAGLSKSNWTENINDLDFTWPFIRFRLTLISNDVTLLNPSFDSIVIPYRR
jgi:hypothetical protein